MTEKEFLKQVCEIARLHGWEYVHFRPGMTRDGRWMTAMDCSRSGFPDLVLVNPRGKKNIIFAELKVGTNKLTTEQAIWRTAIGMAGAEIYEWRPEDMDAIARRLGQTWEPQS